MSLKALHLQGLFRQGGEGDLILTGTPLWLWLAVYARGPFRTWLLVSPKKHDGPVTKYVKCHAADACYGSRPRETGAEVHVTMALLSTSLYPENRKCELVFCRRGIGKSFQINLPCIGKVWLAVKMIGSISRCRGGDEHAGKSATSGHKEKTLFWFIATLLF